MKVDEKYAYLTVVAIVIAAVLVAKITVKQPTIYVEPVFENGLTIWWNCHVLVSCPWDTYYSYPEQVEEVCLYEWRYGYSIDDPTNEYASPGEYCVPSQTPQ